MSQAILAFGSMFILDFVWAHYTLHLVQKNASLAGVYALAITVCNAVVTIMFVADHWLIIPTAMGAFVGTYVAIKTNNSLLAALQNLRRVLRRLGKPFTGPFP
jgi:hypothetical protein